MRHPGESWRRDLLECPYRLQLVAVEPVVATMVPTRVQPTALTLDASGNARFTAGNARIDASEGLSQSRRALAQPA